MDLQRKCSVFLFCVFKLSNDNENLKIVVNIFLRCSQSEAYERVDEENGIYMKHLKNHICRDEKIEDILHAVTTGIKCELCVHMALYLLEVLYFVSELHMKKYLKNFLKSKKVHCFNTIGIC